jgi:hypothetical protein
MLLREGEEGDEGTDEKGKEAEKDEEDDEEEEEGEEGEEGVLSLSPPPLSLVSILTFLASYTPPHAAHSVLLSRFAIRKSRRAVPHVLACHTWTPTGVWLEICLTVIVVPSVLKSQLMRGLAVWSTPRTIPRKKVATAGSSSRMPVASECSALGTMRKSLGSDIFSHQKRLSAAKSGEEKEIVGEREKGGERRREYKNEASLILTGLKVKQVLSLLCHFSLTCCPA